MKIKIPFGDLQRHYQTYQEEFDATILETARAGWYVLGNVLDQFEKDFSAYCQSQHSIGVGSGTEALHVALESLGIGVGDEVITVTNTCVPTVAAISSCGATPVLVDVDEQSFTMAPEEIEQRIGARTKAIIPVHLYGQPADMDQIDAVAERHGLVVVQDAAQAHGSLYKGRKIGSFGITCFSFYPSKNLGCFGDGGAVTVNSDSLATKLRMIRNYGQRDRYFSDIIGFNSRLDDIQAAVLRVKLKHLDAWNKRRREIAQLYIDKISNPAVVTTKEMEYAMSVFHLFVVRVKKRDRFQDHCRANGVGTMIHYPVPIHLQKSYAHLGFKKGDFPVAEKLAAEIVSLPIYPELTDQEILTVCDVINRYEE